MFGLNDERIRRWLVRPGMTMLVTSLIRDAGELCDRDAGEPCGRDAV